MLAGLLAFLGLTGCRQSGEGTVSVGVVMPESYERIDEPAPSPAPPRGAEGEASCG